MKKSILRLLTLSLAILMLAGSLSSCMKLGLAVLGEENEALLLLQTLNDPGSKSYEISTFFEFVMPVDKYTNTVRSTGTFQTYREGNKNYRYHAEQSLETVILGSYTKLTTSDGFQDGKMYSSYDQAADSSALYSELSRKDYVKHVEEMGLVTDFNFDVNKDNCFDITTVKNDDKTTTATFQSFSDKGMNQFFELMDADTEMFGDLLDVDDIILTLTVDKKLRPETLRIDVIFDELDESISKKDVQPEMYFEITFELDDVEAPADIDFSTYEKVEDLRFTDRIEKQLSELNEKETLYFYTTVVQKVTANNTSEGSSMRYEGSSSNEDGELSFEIKVTETEKLYKTGTLTYEDGWLDGSGTQSSADRSMSDYEARTFLNAFFNPGNFDSSLLKSITPYEDQEGVYLIEVARPNNTHSIASSLGMTVSSSKETLELTMRDGEIVSIKHVLFLRGTVQKVDVSYRVTTTTEFSDQPIEK